MDDSQIAKAFVRLFQSLKSEPRAGQVLGVQLSSVPAGCQPKCLVVMRCDSDDLTLNSIIRKTWVIDATGMRNPTTSPLLGCTDPSDFYLTCPTVKFSTSGKLVRYGLRLGDQWYCTFEAPIDSFAADEATIKKVFDSTSTPDDTGCSDSQASLEFRRTSNDRRKLYQLMLFATFSVAFGGLLTGSILIANVPCILISATCFAIGSYASVRCVMDLYYPFEHRCTFTPTCVQWSGTNDVYPAVRIDADRIRAVHIDLDEGDLSFDTGSAMLRGIRADIDITTEKLKLIRDYIVTHWTSVTVYCIEHGVRRCVSRSDMALRPGSSRRARREHD